MPFVLVKADGSSYSLYGWNKHRKAALQFRSEPEAREHISREGLIGVTVEKVVEAPPPGVDPNGGRTIFGYPEAPRHG